MYTVKETQSGVDRWDNFCCMPPHRPEHVEQSISLVIVTTQNGLRFHSDNNRLINACSRAIQHMYHTYEG
jgi:hypothetical protein